MRLIAHTAIQRDLGQRRVRAPQEVLATSDALPRYVSQRRLAEALSERSKEMTRTQSCCMREVGSPNARAQVRRDVRRHAPFLPKRETAARCERTSHLLTPPDAAPPNEVGGALDAGFRGIPVSVQSCSCGCEKFRDHLARARASRSIHFH